MEENKTKTKTFSFTFEIGDKYTDGGVEVFIVDFTDTQVVVNYGSDYDIHVDIKEFIRDFYKVNEDE